MGYLVGKVRVYKGQHARGEAVAESTYELGERGANNKYKQRNISYRFAPRVRQCLEGRLPECLSKFRMENGGCWGVCA